MNLRSLISYFTDSTKRTAAGLSVLGLLLFTGVLVTHAATSYDVGNEVQMYLDASITSSQTSIVLSTPVLNSSTFTFSTTTGGVLRIHNGSYREDIYYASATVNATTKKVTLNSVTRNICPQYTKTFVSCGNGRSWSKGSIVELTQDARLFNLKANIDRLNTTTGSGGYACGSNSQPCFFTLGVSTAVRNAFTFGTAAGYYPDIFNTSLGVRQYWNGSAWINYGSGSTVNASDTVRGAVQLISAAHIQTRTQTGATSAMNVLTPRWLAINGTGSTTAYYIPQLNQNGVLHSSFFNRTNSGLLITKTGTGLTALVPTSSGQFLRADANLNWKLSSAPLTKQLYIGRAYQLTTNNGGADQNFPISLTSPSNTLSAGSTLVFNASGTGTTGGSSLKYRVKVGSTVVCDSNDFTGAPSFWSIKGVLTVWTSGSSGTARVDCSMQSDNALNNTGSTVTFNTTTSNTLNLTLRSSNGTTGNSSLTTFSVLQSQ